MSPIKLLALIIFFFSLLAWRFVTVQQNQPPYTNGQEIFLQATLNEEPELSNRGQQFSIKTQENHTLYIRTNPFPRYHYGSELAISGMLQVKENEKGREFLSLNFPEITVKKESDNVLFEVSKIIRQRSSALFGETLPPISSSLLLGIVFGAKEDFPKDFFENLRTSGVLHVIAASGMNVSFFTGAIMFSLGTFLKRRLSIIISIFAVIFYSVLVGFEPSIIRASIMAVIAFTASFLGHQRLAVFSLFVAGYAMLLWQPNFLFDVGFQLSFLATLGILVIGGNLGDWQKFGVLKEDLKTTLAAQIATLPIILGVFGSVGLLSVLVNILVLWTVPILMLLGSLAVFFGLLFEPVGKIFLFLALPFLWFFEQVVSFFGGFGWTFTVDTFPWQLTVGYYLLVASVVLGLYRNKLKTKPTTQKTKP